LALVVGLAACGRPPNATAPSLDSFERVSALGLAPGASFSKAMPIRGRVVRYINGAPISGALIRFANDALGDITTTTDRDGHYELTAPGGVFTVIMDGLYFGTVRTLGARFRGDLFFDYPITCAARYGVVPDRRTWLPIEGATLSLLGHVVQSDADGWYRIDVGCPSPYPVGGTTVMTVTHPNYMSRLQVVGRGVDAVGRVDIDLVGRL
jgi:hypothetical protein